MNCPNCKNEAKYDGRDFRGIALYVCPACGKNFDDEDDVEDYGGIVEI